MEEIISIARGTEVGGRRSGTERRKSFVFGHFPERRSGMERRTNSLRAEQLKASVPWESKHHYMEFASTQKGFLFAALFSMPIWAIIILLIANRLPF